MAGFSYPRFCFRERSHKQCEQCNHTHSDNQHCECYGIVVQPISFCCMMMPPCSQPLGEREDPTEAMPPVVFDSGSRQDDQFGRMVRTTARRPARCGKPDPFAPKENPATGRELWRGSGPRALVGG
jgi:hypothetical protein